MKPYTVLKRDIVKLPSLCAWCGSRHGERQRQTTLSHQVLWIQARMTLSLPICDVCNDYVEALHQAEMQVEMLLYVLWLPVSAILTHLILRGTNETMEWLAFVLGTAVLAILLVRGSVWALHRTLPGVMHLRTLTGSPPHGYASESTRPGEVTRDMQAFFYNLEFQRQFSALNPDTAIKAPPSKI